MIPRTGLKIAVGVFVLAGLLLFAVSLFFLGQRGRYFSTQHSLKAFFTSAAGLREGATVRLAGVAVGRVARLQLPRAPEQKVLVELSVAGDAIENIRRDSVARIETLGFLGDKFVDISVGSPQEGPLPSGATLRVEEPVDFGALVSQGQRVLGHSERIAVSLEKMLSTLAHAKTVEAVAGATRAAEGLATSLTRGNGVLPWLANDPESKRLLIETLGSVRAVTAALERGDGAIPWLIRDPASRRFVQDLGRAAEVVAALSTEVKEGRGLAHALIYDPGGAKVLEEASQTLEGVRSLLQAIRSGEGAIPTLLFDPKTRALVENFTEVSRHLRTISEKVAQGEGTLGGFLVDPTVYEDLTALLEGAQRSWMLRSVIRSTLESGRELQKK
ncbi:MAG: MCE family protein [candidate division NC10 bacterium]|nr:MCE family protein [candidate division NC10 bacterium]